MSKLSAGLKFTKGVQKEIKKPGQGLVAFSSGSVGLKHKPSCKRCVDELGLKSLRASQMLCLGDNIRAHSEDRETSLRGLSREAKQDSKSTGEDEEHPRKKPGNARFEVSSSSMVKERKSLFLLFLLFLWIRPALWGGGGGGGGEEFVIKPL